MMSARELAQKHDTHVRVRHIRLLLQFEPSLR